jgi:hypothetical protein
MEKPYNVISKCDQELLTGGNGRMPSIPLWRFKMDLFERADLLTLKLRKQGLNEQAHMMEAAIKRVRALLGSRSDEPQDWEMFHGGDLP